MEFKHVYSGPGSNLLKSLEVTNILSTIIFVNNYHCVALYSQSVRELLGIQIPEGEAKLLSNGKLTCMICIQRPIFNTINVLSIHRKGKKHLSGIFKIIIY